MVNLLTPAAIGKVKLKNRVVFPSMCLYYSDQEGNVTDKLVAFIEKRARGGVGSFIIPANPHGANKPNRASIDDDSRIAQWRRLTDMVHSYEGRVFCQIHPSGIQFGRAGFCESPLELPTESVQELIESYAQGALRAKKAGFDGVEIHGAHGHEVALFLSSLLNKRKDKYGAGVEGHARIVTEMIERIKVLAGADFPVILRISGEERLPGGREIDETLEICRLVEAAGADAIHVSVGMPDSEEWECPPCEIPQGHLASLAEVLKRNLQIPVIVVGRIVDWKVAEDIISSEKADLIAVGRALLAEPGWMDAVGRDAPGQIRLCIGCNQGCRTKRGQDKSPTMCLQNPLLGQEEKIHIKQDRDVKKVCIVGAGVSGLEAAYIMAQRGHEVTVFEKENEMGGIFRWASVPPGKKEYLNVLKFYEKNLLDRGVRFVFNCEVAQLPKGFDIYLLAVGGQEIIPEIKNSGAQVYRAVDLLAGDRPDGDSYVVIGDGLVGYETADYLVGSGKKVILVGDSVETPLERLGIARWHFMKERFKHGDITIIGDSVVTAVGPSSFVISGKNGETREIFGRYKYVTACGYRVNDELYTKARDSGENVYLVGSAKNCGDAMESIHDAFFTALAIPEI